MHEHVVGAAHAHAAADAWCATAPDARLAAGLVAPGVPAAQARGLVHDHLAAVPVTHEARDLCAGRLRLFPPRGVVHRQGRQGRQVQWLVGVPRDVVGVVRQGRSLGLAAPACGNAVYTLCVEGGKGPALAIDGVIKGLAEGRLAAVARATATPDARLAGDAQGADLVGRAPVLAGQACLCVPEGGAALLPGRGQAFVLEMLRELGVALAAIGNLVHALCGEGCEGSSFAVHEVIEGLAERTAAGDAIDAAAPDARLTGDPQAVFILRYGAPVLHGHALLHGHEAVAADPRHRLEALPVVLLGLLRNPEGHQRRGPTGVVHVPADGVRVSAQGDGRRAAVLAAGDPVGELAVEVAEGLALAVNRVVERLAHGEVVRVAETPSAPHAGLILHMEAVDVRVVAPVAAAQAGGRIPDPRAPMLGRLEAVVVALRELRLIALPAACDAEVELRVEHGESGALPAHHVVERLAHRAGVARARAAATPDARLVAHIEAVQLLDAAAVAAAQTLAHGLDLVAAGGIRGEARQIGVRHPLGDPPLRHRRERRHRWRAEDLLWRQRLAVVALGDLVGGLGKEQVEGLALPVHQEVQWLTKARAVGGAGRPTAPHTRLALNLQPVPFRHLAGVHAAQARELVNDHTAAKLVRHEALGVAVLFGPPP
mmetsp:Transcript_94591/g.263150  ORF Transcript_94591/g.263150 Transcript_94591/m.263150 type:complete len:656 (+) Transcript_94591:1634-3601(+)